MNRNNSPARLVCGGGESEGEMNLPPFGKSRMRPAIERVRDNPLSEYEKRIAELESQLAAVTAERDRQARNIDLIWGACRDAIDRLGNPELIELRDRTSQHSGFLDQRVLTVILLLGDKIEELENELR